MHALGSPMVSRPASGFTFVAMLVAVAVISISLAVAGPLWSQQVRREHERELMRIGALYAQALASYRRNSPGTEHRFPSALADLLDDERTVRTQRYLRRLYPDPVAPTYAWGVLLDESGSIAGVYSRSEAEPLARSSVQVGPIVLPPARHYSDWHFMASAFDPPPGSTPASGSSR
jgi:type II secretory pathway pseudopilin PulG